MKLTRKQIDLLIKLMTNSARKGNLATSAIVINNGKTVAASESLVVTNSDQTSHAERLLVEKLCKEAGNPQTPGLTMVSVMESCLMCLSACSQAEYREVAYIIPGNKYFEKIPWTIDSETINNTSLSSKFTHPVKYSHLTQYEYEFSTVFEGEMSKLLKIELP